MDATSRKLLEVAIALGALALAGLALAGAGGTAAPPGKTAPVAKTARVRNSAPIRKAIPISKTAPIVVDASRSEADIATHHLTFYNVVITQADLRITAQRADGTGITPNFQNSRWIFTGDVHLTSELRGNVQSDEAVVEFRDSQIQSAVATGHPAEFEQTASTSGILARGHADEIQYDVGAATVRLTKDAWINYGKDQEIKAPVIVYDMRKRTLAGTGSARPGERVHITIVPKKGAASGAGAGSRRGAGPGAPP